MRYQQEAIARDLFQTLNKELKPAPTEISVEGGGVHWSCHVQRDKSRCQISCFCTREAEYYTDFERGTEYLATSRTSSKADTVAAVKDWLHGKTLEQLYECHPMVDEEKRALSHIHEALLSEFVDLKRPIDSEIEHDIADIYLLRFRAEDRHCIMGYDCGESLYKATFYWDDCSLFQHQTNDTKVFAKLLERWLADHALPSEMKVDFPWLEMSKLAEYYERGEGILGEFLESWDFIEEFVQKILPNNALPVTQLIRAMRKKGYDQKLRAGQSMFSVGLSRSQHHGLRGEQPSLWFHFHPPTMTVQAAFASVTLEEHPLELTHKLEGLLEALIQFDID